MSDDHAFDRAADQFMTRLFERLQDEDPDELDCDLAMGVLSMEFADGTKCILNRQGAARQIWLAEGATAWHFQQDEHGEWLDTKGRGRLLDVLGAALSRRVGRTITLT